ncbi:MAG: hypothetical protein GX625_13605 [Clostridiaceae bacterium]|jgi:hypothetical protein|nr:hypothetical protein [Clostridiaceae bacterium]
MESRGLSSIPLPYEVDEKKVHNVPYQYRQQQFLPSFLRNLRQDDIILIALIVLLLMEGSECDLLLVGILVVVFLAGLDGNPVF